MQGSSVQQQLVHVDLLQLLLYSGPVVGAHDRLLLVGLAGDGDELDCCLVLVGDEFDGAAAALFHEYLGDVDLVVGVGEVGVFQGFRSRDSQFWLFLQHLSQEIDLQIGKPLPFWLSLSNSGPVSTISHSRFIAMISCAFLPMKRCLLKIMQQKMQPTLNTSLIGCDFVDISLILMISGATQPGVPQRTKRQLGSSATVASPKSMMMGSLLRITLSGLRSRWITFLRAISASPRRMPFMMNLRSLTVYLERLLNLPQMGLPSTNSSAKQMEFSDSQTPSSFMRLGWLNILVILISLMRASLPFSCEKVASFPKALIATFFWSFRFTPKYTVAKLPFPSRFSALKRSWKLNWFMRFFSSPSHFSTSLALSLWNSIVSQLGQMKRMPVGVPNSFSSGLYLGRMIWKMVSKVIMKPRLVALLSTGWQKTVFGVSTSTTGWEQSLLRKRVVLRMGFMESSSLSYSNSFRFYEQFIPLQQQLLQRLRTNHHVFPASSFASSPEVVRERTPLS